MRVLGAGVDLQLADLGPAELVAGKHALHGLPQDLGGAALELLAQRSAAQAAGIARVAVVELLVELLAGDVDLLGVDDDDEVAGVDVGRVVGLFLPRRVSAIRVASRPSVWPSASTTYQRRVISPGFAFQVFCISEVSITKKRRTQRAPGRNGISTLSGRFQSLRDRRPTVSQSAGSRARTVAPSARAGHARALYATPPSSASEAPVRPERRSPKPTSWARSAGWGEVDQRRRRGDVGKAPAETEAEEDDTGGNDALDPGQSERRDAHDRQTADERLAAADPLDQVADDEYEPVHADDMGADHREDVPLVVMVSEHHVARQVHHGDHHREAGNRGEERGADPRPAQDLEQRRAARRSSARAGASSRAIVRGSGRTDRTSASAATMKPPAANQGTTRSWASGLDRRRAG